MAKTDENMEKNLETSAIPESKKSFINPKVFLIGLPIFILQLIVVYFVTANILLSKMQTNMQNAGHEKTEANSEETGEHKDTAKVEFGKFVFNIDDIIVNPAGTKGQSLMLTSVGFDLGTEEQLEKFKTKEVVVKDIIISILSGKYLTQLSNIGYRDTLKMEISKNLKETFPETKINNIYFSKYIIQ